MWTFMVPFSVCIFCAILLCAQKAHAARVAEAERAAEIRQAAEAARRKAEATRAKLEAAERAAAQKRHQNALKKIEQERKRREKEQRHADAHALKVARAKELAELAERRLQAEKELSALRSRPEGPAEQAQKEPEQEKAVSLDQLAEMIAPKPFAGETVAFTGTLPTMTRQEAIQTTRNLGGAACREMSVRCTLLVVGENPGRDKLDKAERWGVEKITWQEWFSRAEISWRRRMVAMSRAKEREQGRAKEELQAC